MKTFTGYEYILIDIATQYGLDKLTFEERIKWTQDHINELESLLNQAETKPLYHKAVLALRKAQKGIPTGHLVGMDASCSGIQIMSVVTGCYNGAKATGLVDPDRRADAYTECTALMNTVLKSKISIARSDAKRALMTSFYGSKAVPIQLFGADTEELSAFYQAAYTLAPGAWELLNALLNSWRPMALSHEWQLPDGFNAKVKVMKKITTGDPKGREVVRIQELDNASFLYTYYINEGSEKGLSNAANVVHSIDAYVLRTLHRRCNYDLEHIEYLHQCISQELINKRLGIQTDSECPEKLKYYIDLFDNTGIADIVIANVLDQTNVEHCSTEHLEKLMAIIEGMLQYQPFEVVTIHDEYKCHPNNMNWVRWQYKEILAELADSEIISNILSQIYDKPVVMPKQSKDLSKYIKNSNYGLC